MFHHVITIAITVTIFIVIVATYLNDFVQITLGCGSLFDYLN